MGQNAVKLRVLQVIDNQFMVRWGYLSAILGGFLGLVGNSTKTKSNVYCNENGNGKRGKFARFYMKYKGVEKGCKNVSIFLRESLVV